VAIFFSQARPLHASQVQRRYELELDQVGDVIRESIKHMPDKPVDGGARFSFIKGAVIQDPSAAADERDDSTLSVRHASGAVAERPAARFLANRTYGGLEQRVGETEVVDAVEGRRGIAASYDEEPDAPPSSSHSGREQTESESPCSQKVDKK